MTDSFGIVYFFCPETRGKSLEEIDLIFLKSETLMNSAAAQTLQHKGKDTESSATEEGVFAYKETAP